MSRAEKVDYRLSTLVVLCKDCNQDVGLYPARHQCQVERPPLPPLPPLPTNTQDINSPSVSLLRKASSPALSRFASTRQTSPPITDSPVTRAQSTSRWSPSSRFGRSANSKNNSPNEEKEDNPTVDYFDHFSAHLPSANQSPSLRKKWGGSIRQNEKWKQLNDKVDQQKQQQSSPKFWKRLVRATQNMAVQDDQGPDSDESDWEGESHVSRILREYHEIKHPYELPSWLLDGKRSTATYTTNEDKVTKLLDRQNSRRRLWDANTTPSARELELESLRQDQHSPPHHSNRTSGRLSRSTVMHDSDHSDDVDDTQRRSSPLASRDPRPDDQQPNHRKNKRLERMQSARRCMEDQYRDVDYRQPQVDDILAQACQAALSRSRSDRALRSAYHPSDTTATEITPSNYRSYMNQGKQDRPLDDLAWQKPKQRYLVPEKRDGLGLF